MEVLQRTANRGSVSTGPYQIDNSYKNENDNTERMYRAWGGITANTRTWTVSLWVKRTELGACYLWGAGGSGNDVLVVDFDSSDRLGFRSTKDAANDCVYRTNRVFRDTSAWYHLVFAIDTTSSTAGNRLRIYVNGVEETSFATETNFDQNDLTLHNANGSYMEVGSVIGESPRFNGYIAEVNSITGTQYAPTAFGKFDDDSGIWIPILFAGSYAENSVFLEFKDSSSLGTDTSGNGQTFTLQNLSAADQATDTPTNNFCVLNILDQRTDTPSITTEGATVNVQDPGSGTGSVRGTMGASSGKWYWEFELDAFEGSSLYYLYGISSLDVTAEGGKYPGSSQDGGYSVGIYGQNGNVYYNGSNTTFETSGPGADGDLIGVFLDLDNSTLRFAKNGTLIGNVSGTDAIARSSASLTGKNFWTASVADGTNSTALRTLFKMNFGGYTTISISTAQSDANGYGTFEYTPNDGTYDYYALCTKNLAEYG